ncbi:MAG: PLP-dependent cysteine synthase family protein [Halobacteriales archaeon]|nr:PLP-dependent cysteine synthase family protein [Halobacteriales archaeon]
MEIDEGEIGETPLVRLEDVGEPDGANIYAKVEWFNLHSTPYGGGSVKSRPALYMINEAEESGELTHDKTVIEPTSGNTGSEVAKIARNRGYEVVIVMPDNAGEGKIKTVEETGAETEFVDAMEGYDAVIERADEIIESDPDEYYKPDQYSNPANPLSHEETTGVEIREQAPEVTEFVAGVGTGGTITGVGRALRDTANVVAVEPDSAMHAIDGLKFMREGDHIVPEIYDSSVLDEKLYISTDDAYDNARLLKERYEDENPEVVGSGQHDDETLRDVMRVNEDFLVGTSSGCNLQAAIRLAESYDDPGDAHVVTMFCDRGDKYTNNLWRDYFS